MYITRTCFPDVYGMYWQWGSQLFSFIGKFKKSGKMLKMKLMNPFGRFESLFQKSCICTRLSQRTKYKCYVSVFTFYIVILNLYFRKKLETVGEEEKEKLLVEKDKQISELNDLIATMKQDHSVTVEKLR